MNALKTIGVVVGPAGIGIMFAGVLVAVAEKTTERFAEGHHGIAMVVAGAITYLVGAWLYTGEFV